MEKNWGDTPSATLKCLKSFSLSLFDQSLCHILLIKCFRMTSVLMNVRDKKCV